VPGGGVVRRGLEQPEVHPLKREKIWVACEAHRQWLTDYVDVRGFLRRVERL
jgi:hypothetical protein